LRRVLALSRKRGFSSLICLTHYSIDLQPEGELIYRQVRTKRPRRRHGQHVGSACIVRKTLIVLRWLLRTVIKKKTGKSLACSEGRLPALCRPTRTAQSYRSCRSRWRWGMSPIRLSVKKFLKFLPEEPKIKVSLIGCVYDR